MKISRRKLLAYSVLGLAVKPVLAALPSNDGVRRLSLVLREEQRNWFDDIEHQINVWGFGQDLLRLRQGEPVEIEVWNSLPVPSTVHWHGFRIENAMDGVSGLTQAPIPAGERFTYRFTPSDAGTFWAHSHHKTYEQLARGLYLPIIVEENSPVDVDQDIHLAIDDWRINQSKQLDLESLGAMHEWAHGGRLGNFLTVNKQVRPKYIVKAGSRVRLRLLNTANARIFAVNVPVKATWILSKDGQPLVTPKPLDESLLLAPAERYDLAIDIPQNASGSIAIQMPTDSGPIDMALLEVVGTVQNVRGYPPIALPSNSLEEVGFINEPKISTVLDMQGGAMGSLRQAIYDGKNMSMQELIQHKQIWAFNGVANRPVAPLLEVRSGDVVEIDIRNNTGWAHSMHLHGHHFKAELPRYSSGIWHDTLLMDSKENAKIRFVAGKPGSWLLHCHMIEHQAAGMVSWIKVVS